MIAVTVRLFVVATLVAPMSALAAQQVTSPRPGGGPPNLPPHVQAQLWPTRELSPAEQELKTHRLVWKILRGGERVAWGAKTITEGGYYSLPSRFNAPGLLLVGEGAGLVNVPRLKGIHYAI